MLKRSLVSFLGAGMLTLARKHATQCAQREGPPPWQARAIIRMKYELMFTIATWVANFNLEGCRFIKTPRKEMRMC